MGVVINEENTFDRNIWIFGVLSGANIQRNLDPCRREFNKLSQLSLDISPRRFFYDAIGSINIPGGLVTLNRELCGCKLVSTCTLLGPGAESFFKLAINSDANGLLVYFQRTLPPERSSRPFLTDFVDSFDSCTITGTAFSI